MCVVFYTLHQPGFRLILAANRDEYLDRPATEASWHSFGPFNSRDSPCTEHDEEHWVLSGRDVGSPAAGTWLGITRDLRIGAITNIRYPLGTTPADPPSRGKLLKDFLAPHPHTPNSSMTKPRSTIGEYLSHHEISADKYEGFNLLLFDLYDKEKPEVGYLTNRPKATQIDLSPNRTSASIPTTRMDGLIETHGLSNTPLYEPFLKVSDGQTRMGESLRSWNENNESETHLIERMMDLLSQSIPLSSLADAAKSTLIQPVEVGPNPDHPLQPGEKPRWYATRVSTVIMVRDDGSTTFVERDRALLIDGNPTPGGERRFDSSAVVR